MKIETAMTNNFTAAGFGEARRFGFEMNAMAFHAVIDGIYSDKIAAPVREYATNAYDAHRMAGKGDDPFVMMAPSTFNPFFMVRDFGPGMTHDEVMDRATTMFASDKRDTNDQVGMLGLGMKSAFSYTKQYTITCYDGVEQREYVCYLDAAGAPTVTAMDPVPSEEPRGVKISFPVKQGDIYRFQQAISKVMIGFDPMPKILNDQFKPDPVNVVMEGSNFQLVSTPHIKQPHIRQGCVLYPLSLHELDVENRYDFQYTPIIIDVPIGTANVSTSREQLGYDAETKANLTEIWTKSLQELQGMVELSLDEPDDFHEACVRLREMSKTLPFPLLPREPKWRGKYRLRTQFTWCGHSGEDLRSNILLSHHELAWISRRSDHPVDPMTVAKCVIALETFDCTFGKERLRRYRQDNPTTDVIWVKGAKDADQAINYFGVTKVVDLREIERLRIPRVSVSNRYERTDIRNFDRTRWVLPSFDLNQDAIYVHSEGHDYRVFDRVMTYSDVQRLFVDPLTKLGHRRGDFIVLLKDQRSLAKGRNNWVHLDELVKREIANFDPKEYVRKISASALRGDFFTAKLHAHLEELPKRLKAFIEDLWQIPTANVNEMTRAALYTAVTGEEIWVDPSFAQRLTQLTERYPLLHSATRDSELMSHYLKLIRR